MSTLEGVSTGIPNLEEEIEKVRQAVETTLTAKDFSFTEEESPKDEVFLDLSEEDTKEEHTKSHPGPSVPQVDSSPSTPPPLGPTPQDL